MRSWVFLHWLLGSKAPSAGPALQKPPCLAYGLSLVPLLPAQPRCCIPYFPPHCPAMQTQAAAPAALTCTLSHRSTRSSRPTAPTTTTQSLQPLMNTAYGPGA